MSQTYSVTKQIEFDYGHRVPHHDSVCRNVHGHRGKVEVTVTGPLVPEGSAASDEGMVMDFKKIKEALISQVHARFDHRFIMASSDVELWSFFKSRYMHPGLISMSYEVVGFGWVQEIPGVPTAENLAHLCFQWLAAAIDNPAAGIYVSSVRFWETPNSMAEYKG